MESITLYAPAKLNLFLDIVGVLENGYHSLFMLMQAVSLSDNVKISKNTKGIKLSCSVDALPTDQRNIAYKAAEFFFEEAGVAYGAEIHIEKNIPFEAGLGGGSADAAAVLLGLNHMLKESKAVTLSSGQLSRIALRLGSDVPFALLAAQYMNFGLGSGTAIALNKGEVLAPLPCLAERYCVIVKPARGISTIAAYKAYDRLDARYHQDNVALSSAAAQGDWTGICLNSGNIFEQCVEVPNRATYKAIMRENGAQMSQMTGSGSAVFGIFEDEIDAKKAAAALRSNDSATAVFICKTL